MYMYLYLRGALLPRDRRHHSHIRSATGVQGAAPYVTNISIISQFNRGGGGASNETQTKRGLEKGVHEFNRGLFIYSRIHFVTSV